MKRKKIIFALNTEFCLLVSLQYLDKYFDDTYEPIWVLLQTTERFSCVKFSELPGKYFLVNDYLNTRKLIVDTSWLDNFSTTKADVFVLQNNYKVSSLALLATLKKTNPSLKVAFISDSIALDVLPSKRTILISNIYLNYRKTVSNLPRLPATIIPAIKYLNQVDYYMSKNLISSTSAKHISFHSLLNNQEINKKYAAVFPFNFTDDNDIYFFTQPILNHSCFSDETKKQYIKTLELVSFMAKKYKKKLLVKVHPSEDVETYMLYSNDFCTVFKNNTIPAEVLLSKIKCKKIMSCFSSVSTLDFSSCNSHFWFYPLVKHYPFFRRSKKDILLLSSFKDIENMIFKVL